MKQIVNKLLVSKKALTICIGCLALIIASIVIINTCFVILPVIKLVDDSEYVYSSSEKKAIINYVSAVADYYNGIVLGKYDMSESSDRLENTSAIISVCIDNTESQYLFQTCYADLSLCDYSIKKAQIEYNELVTDSIYIDEENGEIKTKKISIKDLKEIKSQIKYAAKLSKSALK